MPTAKKKIRNKQFRQKNRRWGFEATIVGESKVPVKRKMPGLVLGVHSDAIEVADRLKAQFTQASPALNVTITPIPYETISLEVRIQFESIQAQANLVSRAAFILAEKYRLSVGVVDKDVAMIVDEAVKEAMDMGVPAVPMAAPADQTVSVEAEPEVKPARERGIAAVEKALAEPVPESLAA